MLFPPLGVSFPDPTVASPFGVHSPQSVRLDKKYRLVYHLCMTNETRWKKEDLLYFAGFFDGEGCFNIRIHHPKKHPERSHYMCRMLISCTDKEICEWAHKTFGGNLNPYQRKTHYKTVYHWSLSGPPMTEFVKQIIRYLRVKKPQAEVMLKFRSTFDPKRWNQTPLPEKFVKIRANCIQDLHILNHRGTLPPCPLSPSALRWGFQVNQSRFIPGYSTNLVGNGHV